MKLSEAIKPISYFKAHASEIINDIVENQNTMAITQNGEAKVVIQDLRSFEETQESLAFLKIIALSKKSVESGHFKDVNEAFSHMDRRNSDR